MKNLSFISLFISMHIFIFTTTFGASAVVNGLDGGRLGDKLLTYTRAYWVARSHNLDLYIKHFPYADKLQLWVAHKIYGKDKDQSITRTSKLEKLNDININGSTLYTVNYYFFLPEWEFPFDVTSWTGIIDNQEFRTALRETIAPREPITLSELPSDRLTVAMHVRRGGGFDAPLLSNPTDMVDAKKIMIQMRKRPKLRPRPRPRPRPQNYADRGDPLKFPPLSFYVDSLQILADTYKDFPLYVYIFTDDKDPLALQYYFEKNLLDYNIRFDCRMVDNRHDRNVLDDLFDMARYDFLIRPASSYSQVAQLIGNHHMVLYPREAKWQGNILTVTKIIKAEDNIMTCLLKDVSTNPELNSGFVVSD